LRLINGLESLILKPMTITFPEKLLEGYNHFMTLRFANAKAAYRDLAEQGQKPETMVIACCDSRAAPEMIFSTAPGEMFVTRNVANLMPPYTPDGATRATSAALEYAVQVLKVKDILVLGHGRCGGIQAALDTNMEPLSPGDFIGKWMELLGPAAETVSNATWMTQAERQTALERLSIKTSLENLRTFPCVSILEGKGRLALHGAWFDISSGELWVLDPKSGDFMRPAKD
jgi:carbonic anhydrase